MEEHNNREDKGKTAADDDSSHEDTPSSGVLESASPRPTSSLTLSMGSISTSISNSSSTSSSTSTSAVPYPDSAPASPSPRSWSSAAPPANGAAPRFIQSKHSRASRSMTSIASFIQVQPTERSHNLASTGILDSSTNLNMGGESSNVTALESTRSGRSNTVFGSHRPLSTKPFGYYAALATANEIKRAGVSTVVVGEEDKPTPPSQSPLTFDIERRQAKPPFSLSTMLCAPLLHMEDLVEPTIEHNVAIERDTQVFGMNLEDFMTRQRKQSSKLVLIPKFLQGAISCVLKGIDNKRLLDSSCADEVGVMKALLNSGDKLDFSKVLPEAAFQLIIEYVLELPTPLIPVEQFQQFYSIATISDDKQQSMKIREITNGLPIFNKALFVVIIKLLLIIFENGGQNNTSIEPLTSILRNCTAHKYRIRSSPEFKEKFTPLMCAMIQKFRSLIELEALSEQESVSFYSKYVFHSQPIRFMRYSCGKVVSATLSEMKLWNSSTRDLIKTLDIPAKNFTDILLKRDHLWIADDEKGEVWDVESSSMFRQFSREKVFSLLEVGNYVWFSTPESVSEFSEQEVQPVWSTNKPGVTKLILCGNRVWGLCPKSKRIYVWDIHSKVLVTEVDHPCLSKVTTFASVDCGNDNREVWCVTETGATYILSAQTYSEVVQFKPVSGVKPVCLMPFRNQLWSGMSNGAIVIWNPKKRTKMLKIYGYHSDSVNDLVDCSEEEKNVSYIWSGSSDQSVIPWKIGKNAVNPRVTFTYWDNGRYVTL